MTVDREAWRDDDGGRSKLGGLGGDWHGLRPTFDNPMSWSIPLGRYAGIAVRAHVILLIFVVIQLLRSLAPAEGGMTTAAFPVVAVLMGALVVIVLAHEVGHCLACRLVGGRADEILLWPLGGLAYCRPGHDWRSHLVTASGGPAVNVAVCLVAGVVLGAITGRWLGVALPNPLVFDGMAIAIGLEGRLNWPLLALFALHWTSLLLLLFNLLPIYPLDGGRITQALLWPRVGYGPATRLAVRAGFVGAIALGVFGAVMSQWLLVAIAIFGGVTCWITRKQLEFTDTELGLEPWAGPEPVDDEVDDRGARPGRLEATRVRRRERVAAAESVEVDRILAKINDEGMDSLTLRERRLLRRVTRRRQAEDAAGPRD